MSETPTPRTDAHFAPLLDHPDNRATGRTPDFCRQLETDLEAANAETKKWVTLTAEKSQEATEWCAKFISERDNLQHLARVAGEALDLHDTDTDLQPGEELTMTVTYEDQKALRAALSEIQRIKNHE